MDMKTKILHYWHIPTSVITFQKFLLNNRNISLENNLNLWQENILSLEDLNQEENELLKELILRIDHKQTQFTLEVLYSLTKDTVVRYLDERYVLLKYLTSVTYGDLWNGWYCQTRGCVIDMLNLEVATASLPKFFNINEKPHTTLENVIRKMKKGDITKYIKQDGSCISISSKDKLIITTPGSFFSKQTKWALEHLENKHSDFLTDFQNDFNHLTFVFEYVGPENRIVVFYPKTDMVLLHIIDSTSGKILPYKEVVEFANKYGFTPCEVVGISLEEMIQTKDLSSLYKADEQEGWIIRIDTDEETFLVKLKCGDYINMHRLISDSLNPKWIYDALLTETFDDKVSAIEQKEIRDIVTMMAKRIVDWSSLQKSELLTIVDQIPSEQWMDNTVLKNYLDFRKEISLLSNKLEKADKVLKHLENFSKGKLSDPKEEIRLKAKKLFDTKPLNLELLNAYDSYKMFISKRMDDFITSLKNSIHNYVFNGIINEEHSELLKTHFVDLFDIEKNVDDLENWKEIFAKNKEEYHRLVSIHRDKLTPQYFSIHEYVQKLNTYNSRIKEFISLVKKEVLNYLLKERDSSFKVFLNDSWVINDELLEFYRSMKELETNGLKLTFPKANEQELNSILKEFYSICRGLEIDNSYETALNIFSSLDENLRDQRLYYQLKGKFSNFVYKNIPESYRQIVFDAFELDSVKRKEFLSEFDFLPFANILTTTNKDTLTPFDIDFSDIKSFTVDIPLNE